MCPRLDVVASVSLVRSQSWDGFMRGSDLQSGLTSLVLLPVFSW